MSVIIKSIMMFISCVFYSVWVSNCVVCVILWLKALRLTLSRPDLPNHHADTYLYVSAGVYGYYW